MEESEIRETSQISISLSSRSNQPLVNVSDGDRTKAIEENENMEQTHIESGNPQPDFISYFKAKLKHPKQNCCYFQFCTLWLAVHLAMLFIFLYCIGIINDIINYWKDRVYAWSIILCIFVSIEGIIFIFACRGLYKCDTRWILAQYILCWITLLVVIGEFIVDVTSFEYTHLSLIEFIIGLLFQIYNALVFRRVYLWSKYYQNGGKYDVTQMQPYTDKCRVC